MPGMGPCCECRCHDGPPDLPFGWTELTPAEREVAAEVAAGRTNTEVADRLGITRATVKTHLEHIYAKLGVNRRAALAGLVARTGT